MDFFRFRWKLKLMALVLAVFLWLVLHFNATVPAAPPWSRPAVAEPAR